MYIYIYGLKIEKFCTIPRRISNFIVHYLFVGILKKKCFIKMVKIQNLTDLPSLLQLNLIFL